MGIVFQDCDSGTYLADCVKRSGRIQGAFGLQASGVQKVAWKSGFVQVGLAATLLACARAKYSSEKSALSDSTL